MEKVFQEQIDYYTKKLEVVKEFSSHNDLLTISEIKILNGHIKTLEEIVYILGSLKNAVAIELKTE